MIVENRVQRVGFAEHYLKENIAKISCDESENESSSIQSSPSLMVDELCLHPCLRKDILNHFQPTIRHGGSSESGLSLALHPRILL